MKKKRVLFSLLLISFLLAFMFKYYKILTYIGVYVKSLIVNNMNYLNTIDYINIIKANSLNGRELAISIWIIISLIYMVNNKKIRQSLVQVIKCACNSKFVIITMVLIVYNILAIILLNKFGFWNTSLIKDTIVWFLFSGLVIVFKSIENNGNNNYFKNIILDNFKIVILIQFILSEYTMSFLFEFISIPIFFFIGAASVIVKNKSEYKDVKKLLMWVQNILFIVIIYNSFKFAIGDIRNLGTYNNLLKIIVPGVLSILSIVPAYLLALYSSYEKIFVRLNFYKGRSRRLSLYLKARILLYCNINLKRVNSLWHDKNKELFYLTDKKEINSILS